MLSLDNSSRFFASLVIVAVAAGCTASGASTSGSSNMRVTQGSQEQILLGRQLVVSHACGDCHGGGSNPAAFGWLDGDRDPVTQEFQIGPFKTRARNLT